jgi:uncharacterized membrane protein YGL010W
MISLKQQIQNYGAYHRDPRNKLTHFIGVPLVTFSLFEALAWFRFVHAPGLPITAATFFYLAVLVYYTRLDPMIAWLQFPFTFVLFCLADMAAVQPAGRSVAIFLSTFVLGWIIQLVGHAIEGKRPALADNLLQVFNAPLFLTVEVLAQFGLRGDLSQTETLEPARTSA